MYTRKIIKIINKNTIILCFFLFAGYIPTLYNSISEVRSDEISINHVEYKELVYEYFPNFVLVDINDLEPCARDYFRSCYPNLNPSLVSKDFDGNGHLDIALLLWNSEDKDGKTIFAIFLQLASNQFRLEFSFKMDFYHGDVFILPIEPGVILTETEAIEGPGKEVKLKNAAIHLRYFEKSSVAYYWSEKTKKFESIWTSD